MSAYLPIFSFPQQIIQWLPRVLPPFPVETLTLTKRQHIHKGSSQPQHTTNPGQGTALHHHCVTITLAPWS